VAGGAPADPDDFLALGYQLELGVKCADAVDSAWRNIQVPGYLFYRRRREVMESFLRFLENRDEFFPVGSMAGEYILEFSLFRCS
jgi:hypothetical protein